MKFIAETNGQTLFTWNDEEFVLDTSNNVLHQMIENTCYDVLGADRSVVLESNTIARRLKEMSEAVEAGNHTSSVPNTDYLIELTARRDSYYQELTKLVYLLRNL